MLHFLLIISLCNIFFIAVAIFNNGDSILKVTALTISLFLFFYTILSGVLFYFNCFSFINVTSSVAVFTFTFALILLPRSVKALYSVDMSFKTNFPPLALILLGFVLTVVKFELFDNGQDQGLYQAEAIELFMGNYEVQHDFEEYQLLSDEQDRCNYQKMLNETITGYYPLSSRKWPTISESEIISDVSGMYHGIQTFPALLALSAKIFGLSQMAQIQTIFFLCAICLFYFAAKNLKISTRTAFLSSLIFICSPLMLWISKSYFTEMFLTLAISVYLFFLTDVSTSYKRFLMVTPLVAFTFVHVSFLLLFPIFVFINTFLFLKEFRKEFLYGNIILSGALFISYSIMSHIAPQYFFDNCSRLYFSNIVTANNFMIWVFVGTTIISGISFSLCHIKKNTALQIHQKFFLFGRFIPVFTVILLLFMLAYGLILGYFREPNMASNPSLYSYYGTGLFGYTHLSIYAISMSIGYAAFFYLLQQVITKNKIMLSNETYLSICLLFFYCILFQAAFIRKEVSYYYYYSRYWVFYIPIICLLLAAFFSFTSFTKQLIIVAISIGISLVFDKAIIFQKDDTMLEWENLEDLSNIIKPNSALLLETPQLQKLLGPQIRALASCSIFPVSENSAEQLELLKSKYDNIYYLKDNSVSGWDILRQSDFAIVYRDSYVYSKNPINPMCGHYPLIIPNTKKELLLYHYQHGVTEQYFDVMDGSIRIQNGKIGMDGNNPYVQSTGKTGAIIYGPYMSLPKGDYYLRVPVDILSQEDNILGYCKIYICDYKDFLPTTELNRFLTTEEDKTYFKIPFTIDEAATNIEFLFSSTNGSIFRIYSYSLYNNTPN